MLIGVAVICLFGLALTGCDDDDSAKEEGAQTADGLLDEIVKRGSLKVGMSTFGNSSAGSGLIHLH